MSDEHPTRVLPCEHEICQGCFHNWRKTCTAESKNVTCPNCRFVIEKVSSIWDDIDMDEVEASHDDNSGWYYPPSQQNTASHPAPFETMSSADYMRYWNSLAGGALAPVESDDDNDDMSEIEYRNDDDDSYDSDFLDYDDYPEDPDEE